MRGSASASVIVPAHNEARAIGRCLRALLNDADDGEFDVIVVCNGCNDATAEVARAAGAGFDIKVLELARPSKVSALNEGDSAATCYPRLYLDADVELRTEGARALLKALNESDCVVASPRLQLDSCSPLARRYWQAWQRRNPQPRSGTGCYGLGRAARDSFDDFPEVMGDDEFIARRFSPKSVGEAVALVRPSRSVLAIARRRVRIESGNRQITNSLSGSGKLSASGKRSTRSAHGAPMDGAHRSPLGALLLVAIHVLARLRSLWPASPAWKHDEASREAVDSGG